MKTIFDFDDYKSWVQHTVKLSERGGRGAYKRIADALKVNTSMVSQVFKGNKDLSIEGALELAHHFGLSAAETDFFVALVDLSRAGTARLRTFRRRRLEALRKQSQDIAQRLPPSEELRESDKAVFYSHWYYAAISLICGIDGVDSAQSIARALNLTLSPVRSALDFLLASGLVKERTGKLAMGTARTHIPHSSPLAARHHLNWRIKNVSRAESLAENELMFTSPMTLSAVDAARVRAQLVDLISNVSKIVEPSPSEELWSLNLDFVRHYGRA